MECQSSDSKKLYKVFDASQRKRTRKKRDGLDDTNSVATDDSVSVCQGNGGRGQSVKVSLQDIPNGLNSEGQENKISKSRETDTSPSMTRSPVDLHRSKRSPRRQRRPQREGLSLALKAGLVSTPRSISPNQDAEDVTSPIPQDQDSFIYAFLEEAIKRDKKKHRHSHRHDARRSSRDRDGSLSREHRRHHHRRKCDVSREHDKPTKDTAPPSSIDQAIIFETFAKLCSQLNEKPPPLYSNAQPRDPVPRTLSHKSLQCEVVSRRALYETNNHPVRLRSRERSREIVTSGIRSQDTFTGRVRNRDGPSEERPKQDKCMCCYDKSDPKYSSRLDVSRSRQVDDDRYRDYPSVNVPTRSCIDHYRSRPPDNRDYRDNDRDRRHYENEKRKYCEQKTSRSFDVQRGPYLEDDRVARRTARSDINKDRRCEDRRYVDGKYYDVKAEPRNRDAKDKPWRKNVERCDRNSVVSRDDDYRERDRERDRYSERERDSGLSVADGETSTMSGRSNCLKVVKQEIAEQREAMDKMMKLWKELMRCFKGISQTHVQDKAAVHDSAANVRESAAAQLRLWRECMRRYETVARDVGDTDARLMEEITKQRSEMAEMSGMWQECLQRYRDMSTDFNTLKQKLATSESPTRLPTHAAPLVCAEGEGGVPPAPYRLPHNYPPQVGVDAAGYACAGGSPLRTRASAPPAWWWCDPQRSPRSPRRRSSPDSRASRDRDHRRRHKDRDESGYKEKSSKPGAARSEHRHRKR